MPAEQYRAVIDFAESMAGFLWGRGHWRDRIRLCEKAAEAALRAGDPVARARQFALIGRVHVWLGEYTEAEGCLRASEEALPAAAGEADRRETLRLRGHIASRIGEFATARSLFERILATAPPTADDEGRAATLVELGVCAVREGEFEAARGRFAEALRLDDEMGVVEGAAVSLSHLAETYYELGNLRGARPLFERGLTCAEQVDRPSSAGRCHLGLAKIDVLERKYPQGRRHARAAAAIFARLGITDLVAEARLIADNLLGGGAPGIAELLARCRAMILDFDDTIAATARTRWPVLRRTAADFGIPLSIETIRAAWGLPFDAMLAALAPAVDPVAFEAAYGAAMAAEKPIPTRGARGLIEALRRRGIPWLIVGSGKRELIMQDLARLGLGAGPGEVFGCEETGAHKPDPRVLRRPLRRLAETGFERDEIVYVGDSVRDYTAAAGNDVPFVAVLSGLDNRADFRRAGLAEGFIVGDLTQLRLWL
ncbi:HAD hydrolase-like protein [Nocardia arthritidis]|uniref:HAD hydrolase-like protein n=1 Tax=Nocardia arthritidis TaxID=228602 RepID=UPI00142D5C77|nr:HAD hydrolase-like protein [Nocardia arthritidis]